MIMSLVEGDGSGARAAVNIVRDVGRAAALGELSEFQQEFYQCLSRRADACFGVRFSLSDFLDLDQAARSY
jgi:hypothetical protein